jgi:hypothetical protein
VLLGVRKKLSTFVVYLLGIEDFLVPSFYVWIDGRGGVCQYTAFAQPFAGLIINKDRFPSLSSIQLVQHSEQNSQCWER